jgi:hypothetical protein
MILERHWIYLLVFEALENIFELSELHILPPSPFPKHQRLIRHLEKHFSVSPNRFI